MRWALAALCLALAGCQQHEAAREGAKARPPLALLTSLPIMFGETFTLDTPTNPLLAALEKEFAVRPVDGPEMLPKGGLLLAIQPQALTAERLVALDAWVRSGGQMVLLADPRLSWESERSLGDTLRPPFTFPDTGLLEHWGLRLLPPPGALDQQEVALAGRRVTMKGAGSLERRTGVCQPISGDVAVSCPIGKGRVTVIADADWVMSGMRGSDLTDLPENRAALIALLQQARH